MSDGAGDQDRSGSPPAYTDLTRACVRAAGSSIRFELTLNGSAPAAMPNDDTVLTLGFSLPRGDSGSSVQAEVDTGGWSAYLTHGQGRTWLSGLRVDGRSVSITVPASQLPASLRWRAESSWTKSTMLTTSYAFDTAPDIGTATFSR